MGVCSSVPKKIQVKQKSNFFDCFIEKKIFRRPKNYFYSNKTIKLHKNVAVIQMFKSELNGTLDIQSRIKKFKA